MIQFADCNDYTDASYQHNFKILLDAQKSQQYVDIDYLSPHGRRIHHIYVPARLEYSPKNDTFRLLALKHASHNHWKLETLNLERMQCVTPTDRIVKPNYDLNKIIQASYYKEPVKLRIANKRNALERAMLHFANYQKNTTKIDENTYECLIYYNQTMETELLIEVLSFGPMLTVLGNERFLHSLKKRLQDQFALSLQ